MSLSDVCNEWEVVLICQKYGRMSSIDFDIISGRRAGIRNVKLIYPRKQGNCWIEKLDISLCRKATAVTKDLDTMINTCKNGAKHS